MSTNFQVMPWPDETRPDHVSTRESENALQDTAEGNSPTINNVKSLKNGIIETSKNNGNNTYTILLVGEAGVGKSLVLELIANVLLGSGIDHCDFDILDHEQRGSGNQRQTNAARLYNLTSKNGTVVRILDTPGLANTRGLQQDELHKKSIATQIKKHIDSVTAVLVLANGTLPRTSVAIGYALSTLSAIFPNLANNIAFIFTHVSNPLDLNFPLDKIPEVFKASPQFLLSNPIALHRKHLKIKDDPSMKKQKKGFREIMKANKQNALEVLVEFFDWLDGLEPQAPTKSVPLYEVLQNISKTPAPMDRAPENSSMDAHAFSPTRAPPPKQKLASGHSYLCTAPGCYPTCSIRPSPGFALAANLVPGIQDVHCSRCSHPYSSHCQPARLPSQSDLRPVVDRAMDDPPQVAEDHVGVPPSQSPSLRVEEATQLSEQNDTNTEEGEVSQEEPVSIRSSPEEQVKKKSDHLRKAKEKVWEGIRKVKRFFFQ